MEQMQFTAVVVLTLLTLKLLLLPAKVSGKAVVSRARWMMVIGIAVLDVQFLLQYMLGLRAMGVTQAVMLNLVMFVPASWIFSMGLLYLQRRGKISMVDRWVGGFSWAVVLSLLGIAAAIDGEPLLSDTPELRTAEIIASGVYLAMQGHYSFRHMANLRAMGQAMQDYYDSDMGGLLRWMRVSVIVLAVLSLMVPALIFVHSSIVLAPFSVIFFVGIYYVVDSFCSYVVSSAPGKVMEAEESETKSEEESAEESEKERKEQGTDSAGQRHHMMVPHNMEELVEQWIAAGNYRKTGMKMPVTAGEIGVMQYQLSAWLRQQGKKYSEWMTELRIAEAQRVLLEHPEWSNEYVAQHCGFTDRSYFHKRFKEATGMTPSDWQVSHGH